jgi:hypothetical protein
VARPLRLTTRMRPISKCPICTHLACQVAHCGGNRERLGRHRRSGCRSGRSATDRNHQRKPDDYRRNRHDDDAAASATDGEGQPDHESGSSQRLLRSNTRTVPLPLPGHGGRRWLANRPVSARTRTKSPPNWCCEGCQRFGRGRFGTDENLYQLIGAEQSAHLTDLG